MSEKVKYIIVDDDDVSNIITNMTIKKALGETEVRLFDLPEDGLDYIQHQSGNIFGATILLLDINMPIVTGWEFLERFEKFSDDLQSPLIIYMLSSSVDQRDKDRAMANKYVKGFISKPLTRETIIAITAEASEHLSKLLGNC